MKIRISVKGIVALTLGFLLAGCSQDYQDMTQSMLKKLVGSDYKKYFWFSYPTDNFGVGTMYETPANVTKLNLDENYLCASATCLQLTDPSAETNELKRLKLSGFADVGEGAAITLNQKE